MPDKNITTEVTNPALAELQSSNDSLLNKNSELLNELKQVKQSLTNLGGIDQLKTMIESNNTAKQAKLEEDNSIDKLKTHFDEQIKSANDRNEELVNGIVKSHMDAHLRSAVTEANGSYTLLEHQLKNFITGEYTDGKVQMTIKDTNGMPMMVDGKDASLNDLINTFKTNDSYAGAFSATANVTGSDMQVNSKQAPKAEASTLSEITTLYKTNPARAMEIMKAKGLA